jgi:hypothetical protein
MKLPKLLILPAALMIQSCAHLTPQPKVTSTRLPQSLTEPCKRPIFVLAGPSRPDFEEALAEAAINGNACANNFDALVEAVRKNEELIK